MTWVLVIIGHLTITGYQSEAACKEAAKVMWGTVVYCVPAGPDARASVNGS